MRLGEARCGRVRFGGVVWGMARLGVVWFGFCEVTNDHVAKKYIATLDVEHRTRKDESAAA